MAAASERLTRIFKDLLRYSYGINRIYLGGNPRLGVPASFSKYLKITLEGDHIEYPVWIKADIERYLLSCRTKSEDESSGLKRTTLVVPVTCNENSTILKGAEPILTRAFEGRYLSMRLKTFKTAEEEGETFYCGKGIVFDSKLNLLCSINVAADYSAAIGKWIATKLIVRVNGSVFQDPQNFMNKAIIQKIIPLALGTNVVRSDYSCFIYERAVKGTVIVEDTSCMMESPMEPMPQKNIDEALNQVLINNLQDLESFGSL